VIPRRVLAAGALLLAACGPADGGETGDADAAVPSVSTEGTAAAEETGPVPPPRRDGGGAAVPEPPPTRADSAAAVAEDVTPEWKQRTRAMQPYGECMRDAAAVPEPQRATVERACANLPSAPRR